MSGLQRQWLSHRSRHIRGCPHTPNIRPCNTITKVATCCKNHPWHYNKYFRSASEFIKSICGQKNANNSLAGVSFYLPGKTKCLPFSVVADCHCTQPKLSYEKMQSCLGPNKTCFLYFQIPSDQIWFVWSDCCVHIVWVCWSKEEKNLIKPVTVIYLFSDWNWQYHAVFHSNIIPATAWQNMVLNISINVQRLAYIFNESHY